MFRETAAVTSRPDDVITSRREGQFEIREATPDDADGIVAVLNPIIETGAYTVLDAPLTADAERAFIRSCSPRGVFLVAIDRADGAVVGFQNTQPLVTYTHALDHVGETGTYVDLSRRRQGIAKHLAVLGRYDGRGIENGHLSFGPDAAGERRQAGLA